MRRIIASEIWKSIEGYETRYEISNFGRVRPVKDRRRIMRQQLHYKGHRFIQFRIGRIKKKFFIHRLVACAFIPKIEGKEIVNHIDGNKKNNCFENLEWVTIRENTIHYHRVIKHLDKETCGKLQ